MRRPFGLFLMTMWLLLALPAGLAGGAALAAPDPGGDQRLSRLQGGASLGRNRPVVGATVLVQRSDVASRFFVTSTDHKGRFQVDGLPDGDYRLEVRREGLRTVTKENVALRFPSRAVIEVTMQPLDSAPEPVPLPAASESLVGVPRVTVRGEVVARDERETMPDVSLRLVRTDGRADPVVVRTGEDGTFELPGLPAGPWRLETRVVGFLPVWVGMDLRENTSLTVSLVPQPAGYDPSPLELMPTEQPIPPERFRSVRPAGSVSEESEEDEEDAAAEEPQKMSESSAGGSAPG